MEPAKDGNENLRINLDSLANNSSASDQASENKPADPLLGAVKDVFMEVDEDVPGGWQGWRVFNEMVQTDIQIPMLATGGISEAGPAIRSDFASPQWQDGNESFSADYDMTNMQMGNGVYGNQGGWEHGFFAGYE
jgi:hypothetical protein